MSDQTSPQPPEGALQAMRDTFVEHRTWFIVLGIALIILGIVAIGFPFMTTIAAKVFLGWLFLIGGIVQIVHAFSTQKWSGFFYNLLMGLLYVIVGGWLAFLPLAGILSLTFMLAFLFILQGVLQSGIAFKMKPHEGWVWMLISGIVAIAAGVLVIMHLPSSATWAIGLVVGVSMISTGWAYLFMALSAGK
jgi:uncharacterized membrane protein HdeD (DUF308 family)